MKGSDDAKLKIIGRLLINSILINKLIRFKFKKIYIVAFYLL